MCLHPFFQVGQDPPGVHARQLEYTMLVAVLQYRFPDEFPGVGFDTPGGIVA
jgi:hypothetical protein